MDFYDVVAARRSIRAYRSDAVEEEKLARIREAVRQAPTACNRQPFRFLELREGLAREAVESCYSREWIRSAPLLVVAVGSTSEAWARFNGRSIYDVDVAIALEHLVLAATAEGLGTCWICAFDQEALHDALGLAGDEVAVAITPLGYPAETPGPIQRKPIADLFQSA